jgi:hypothetical protein
MLNTSGEFLKDNFRRILEWRSSLIIHAIQQKPDNGLMLWSDVDLCFFSDCESELLHLANGNDLLLLREHKWDNACNFGFQVIRRNSRTLAFYLQLLHEQRASINGDIQAVGNNVIACAECLVWRHLPLTYSSESNGGCRFDSILYHANSTPSDSIRRKFAQLEESPQKRKRAFLGFRMKKSGSLEVEYFRGFETRNESTAKLAKLAIEKYQVPDFDWIYVYTGDGAVANFYDGKRLLSYATNIDEYDNVCPDFTFDHWRQTQMDDYEQTWREVALAGDRQPATNMLGWRGNVTTHPSRRNILNYDDKVNFDVEAITWNTRDPNRLTCSKFLSLPEQVRRWRYLLDVEGVGWSGRLKLFFFSKRVVFLQERPFKEWYFPYLIPWTHYVPVKRDLSDLTDKLAIVQNDSQLETVIVTSAFAFAQQNLTRDAALHRWNQLLT